MIFPQIINVLSIMFLFFSRKEHISATTLSQILSAINNWVFQSKIIFNPNLSKKEQKVIFNRKIKKLLHPFLLFNIPLSNSLFQKHLGLTIDMKLSFSEHLKKYYQKN